MQIDRNPTLAFPNFFLSFFPLSFLWQTCRDVFYPDRKRALGTLSARNYDRSNGLAIDAFWEERVIELEKYFSESPKESVRWSRHSTFKIRDRNHRKQT